MACLASLQLPGTVDKFMINNMVPMADMRLRALTGIIIWIICGC